MKNTLIEGNLARQLFELTIPTIWAFFAFLSFTLADTFFIGQLGSQQLAAITFTLPITTIVENIGVALATGAGSVIARAVGRGDREEIKSLTTNSIVLSFAIVAVLAICGLTTIEPLFQVLGASRAILPAIAEYMRIWYVGAIFFIVPIVGNQAILAAGNTLAPSIISTVAALINLILDPILIFGWFGFPSLGIEGAALATLIARVTIMIAALLVLHFQQQMLLFALPKLATVRAAWQSILYISIPAAATNLIMPFSMGFITKAIAIYGNEAVAAFGIAFRIENFAMIPILALSTVLAPFIGQNWGAAKYSRVSRSWWLSCQFCLLWGGAIAVVLAANGSIIAALFDSNPDVINTAATYLILVPVSYAALGIICLFNAACNALGKPLPSLIVILTRMLVFYLPLAYLGSYLFGLNGIFISGCLANFIMGIGVFIWSRKLFKPQ